MRKKRVESPDRSPFRINGNWERTWTEVSDELKKRTGISLTPTWCKYIARDAEKKIVNELDKFKDEFSDKGVIGELKYYEQA